MSSIETNLINWPRNIFILIPAYNSAGDLNTFLPSLLARAPAGRVCVVDDGSHDNTESVCRKLGVDYLKQAVNRGKGAALRKGFGYVSNREDIDWILTMDADGQHAVNDIPTFIEAVEKYPDSGIIIGAREKKPDMMPAERIFSNFVTSKVLSIICGAEIIDSQCGYRIYSSEFIKRVTIQYNRFEMESEVILKACFMGFPVRFIPVQTLYCSSQSHISHIIDILRWIRAVAGVWLNNKQLKSYNERQH
jgi:glycosyltransferase involved in cell wall biosynthesis